MRGRGLTVFHRVTLMTPEEQNEASTRSIYKNLRTEDRSCPEDGYFFYDAVAWLWRDDAAEAAFLSFHIV